MTESKKKFVPTPGEGGTQIRNWYICAAHGIKWEG